VRNKKETWTTLDEIKFIIGLGQWGTKVRNRESLIRGYKEATKERKVWNDGDCLQIDKTMVEAYLEGKAEVVRGKGPSGKEYIIVRKED